METTKQKLKDISQDISLRRFANRYFGKSATWFYNKLDQCDVDSSGRPEQFSPEEINTIKHGLYDLARRILEVANNL